MPLVAGDGQFHAALCYDVKLAQEPIEFKGNHEELDLVQRTPLILQRENKEKFLAFLSDVAKRLYSEDFVEYEFEEGWEENEPTSSVLYDDLNIMTGRFASPSALATIK